MQPEVWGAGGGGGDADSEPHRPWRFWSMGACWCEAMCACGGGMHACRSPDASMGGALYVEKGACVSDISGCAFRRNWAGRGGALNGGLGGAIYVATVTCRMSITDTSFSVRGLAALGRPSRAAGFTSAVGHPPQVTELPTPFPTHRNVAIMTCHVHLPASGMCRGQRRRHRHRPNRQRPGCHLEGPDLHR